MTDYDNCPPGAGHNCFECRRRPLIRVRKRLPFDGLSAVLPWRHKTWCGECTCGKDWQFHFFGATLGFGLEHLRRHQWVG